MFDLTQSCDRVLPLLWIPTDLMILPSLSMICSLAPGNSFFAGLIDFRKVHLCLSVAHVDRLYIVRITYDEDDILSFLYNRQLLPVPATYIPVRQPAW